jgi:hypothetical protein
LQINDKCSIEATPDNSLGVSKAYHNHQSKISVMMDLFDRNHKKTMQSANCAIVNLTQARYKRSNLYRLYIPSSLVRANYVDGDSYAVHEKPYNANTSITRG